MFKRLQVFFCANIFLSSLLLVHKNFEREFPRFDVISQKFRNKRSGINDVVHKNKRRRSRTLISVSDVENAALSRPGVAVTYSRSFLSILLFGGATTALCALFLLAAKIKPVRTMINRTTPALAAPISSQASLFRDRARGRLSFR